jgi:Restriction Endonuclease associating with ARP
MNIFCFPGTLKESRVFDLLGVENGLLPEFGVRARVPLANGRVDRTEIDMRIGDLLVEAKLTESDFQCSDAEVVDGYRDFAEVFERRSLPRDGKRYVSYQLIRNVLAAHAMQCSFCVMADARRPDLQEAWFAIMRCVRILDLRLRCKMITWQELAEALPEELQAFLAEKYGIAIGNSGLSFDSSAGSDDRRPWV